MDRYIHHRSTHHLQQLTQTLEKFEKEPNESQFLGMRFC